MSDVDYVKQYEREKIMTDFQTKQYKKAVKALKVVSVGLLQGEDLKSYMAYARSVLKELDEI